jgi:2-polyprenyl-3-methyl-5-hydroxy-6-metoxy-1,4-benzoquinol methylase
MRTPKCPLNCGDVRHYCRKPPADYFICQSSGMIFQDVLPSSRAMAEHAESEYRSGLYKEYVGAASLKYETFRKRIALLKSRGKEGSRLLDIGCSSGFFLEVALQNNFDAYGIELSSQAIALAKEPIRARITEGDANHLPHNENHSYDLVSAFDIIEHTREPLLFLEDIKSLLRPEGCLILSTPDTGHYLRYIMGSRWPMLQPLQHTYLFSKQAITRALTLTGFHHIQVEAAYKHLSIEYLMGQIRFYNPLLYRIYGGLEFLMPRSVRQRPFSVNIGEILAICNA